MQTRSKAVKRSASEDIADRPAKSSRRVLDSDSSDRRKDEHRSLPKKASLARSRSRGRPESRKRRAPPYAPPTIEEVQDETAEQTAEDKTTNQSQEQDTKPGSRKMRSTQNGPENSEHEEGQDDSPEMQRLQQEKTTAVQLLMQLIVLLEKRRLMSEKDTTLREQPVGMTRLCELAANPDLPSNVFLDALPLEFFAEMKVIRVAVTAANEAKAELDAFEEEFIKRRKAHNEVLGERAYAFLRVKDHSAEAMELHNTAVADARGKLKEACQQRDEANRRWELLLSASERECSVPLAKAESALVNHGHLHPIGQEHPDHLRRRMHDESQTRGSIEPSPRNHRPPPREESQRQSRDEDRRSQNWRQSESREQERRRNIVSDVQQAKLGFLEDARRKLVAAEKRFDDVRWKYYGGLDNFLNAKEDRLVEGTVEDFDHKYYLARDQANHDFAMAKLDWEFALEKAEETDALSRNQRRIWLGDDTSSTHGSGTFVRDLIWGLTDKQIKAWMDDEEWEKTKSERHWPLLQPEVRQEGKPLGGPPSERELMKLHATGKRRRMIDQYQIELDRVREEAKEEMRKRMGSGEPDLPWWQVWDGIC